MTYMTPSQNQLYLKSAAFFKAAKKHVTPPQKQKEVFGIIVPLFVKVHLTAHNGRQKILQVPISFSLSYPSSLNLKTHKTLTKVFHRSDYCSLRDLFKAMILFISNNPQQKKIFCVQFQFYSFSLKQTLEKKGFTDMLIFFDKRSISGGSDHSIKKIRPFTKKKSHPFIFINKSNYFPKSFHDYQTDFPHVFKGKNTTYLSYLVRFFSPYNLSFSLYLTCPANVSLTLLSEEDIMKYILKKIKSSSLQTHRDSLHYQKNFPRFIIHLFQSKDEMKHKTYALPFIFSKHKSKSSLAQQVYRKQFYPDFYPDYKIEKLPLFIDKVLRSSYVGSKPTIYRSSGAKQYGYDINSLYPFIKKTFSLPTQFLVFHPLQTRESLAAFFGFILVTIYTPPKKDIPFLIQNSPQSEIQFIPPSSVWRGWIFSEELKYAVSLGYKVEQHSGLSFSATTLFSRFVHHFHSLKKFLPTKLLLNSFFGRWSKSSLDPLNSQYKTPLPTTTHPTDPTNKTSSPKQRENTNYTYSNNIAISAAVTSYGRIMMHQIKTRFSSHLFYSDTDSLFLSQPLPSSKVSQQMGDFRLVYSSFNALFLQHRTYFLQFPHSYLLKAAGIPNQTFKTSAHFFPFFTSPQYFAFHPAFAYDIIKKGFAYPLLTVSFQTDTFRTPLQSFTLKATYILIGAEIHSHSAPSTSFHQSLSQLIPVSIIESPLYHSQSN